MGIKHAMTSAKSQGPDATLVRANDWNADHVLDVAAPSGLTGATTPARFVGGTVAGAPSTGTFAVNDFVISQDGKIYICTGAGTPGTWVAVSGGADLVQVAAGAGNVRIPGLSGSPDCLPSSPSAYNDEFDALAGWTALGTLDTLNVTDAPSHVHMKIAAPGAWTVYGIYKACPSLPFTVTTKVADNIWLSNYQSAGLIVTEASPGKILTFGNVFANGGNNSGCGVWNSRTSRAGYTDSGYGSLPVKYVRMVVTSSTSVAMFYSLDGFVWFQIRTGFNPGFTVGGVGLYVSGQDSNVLLDAFFDWIRFS